MDTHEHSFDATCAELLKSAPNNFSRHCFRSALNHLERAEKLFDFDSTMAGFRCYTAEEEAATGLMLCLKECKYSNSEHLRPKKHHHKNAFIPFFGVLAQFVEDNFKQYGVAIDLLLKEQEGQKFLGIEVSMNSATGPATLTPDPPFNFELNHEGKIFSYRQQIEKLLSEKGFKEIQKLLDFEANKRNLLLYASPKGYPAELEVTPLFFPAYRNRVMAMLRTYLLIYPYKPQRFIQNSLDAFLAFLGVLKPDTLHEEV